MPELGLSSTYDYSTATSNRKKSIFLVIGVSSSAFLRSFWLIMELADPKSRLVVACGARKVGVSSPYG